MLDPIATYRLQFHKGFNFDNFLQVLPYLQKLGVKTIYASPIFKAVPGSIHGYDVTDVHQVNPEIGTIEQLKLISQRLKEAGISWIQDIVPNHMAFHPENGWLMDVFAQGRTSKYAGYFDIDWEHPDFNGKVAVPILGKPLAEVIKAKEISIVQKGGKAALKYADTMLPLRALSQGIVLSGLDEINNDPDKLQQIIDEQYYVPTHWQKTNTATTYRRFFTINGLISLNMQDEQVFNDYHTLIGELCRQGIFQGLRVDHIDGLADPTTYLNRLREMAGAQLYITVEKILETNEELPNYWPIQGTTGYDFLAAANHLFTNDFGVDKLKKFYKKRLAGASYKNTLQDKKTTILHDYMQGDLDNLYRQFTELYPTAGQVVSEAEIKEAIAEFLILCPVYKLYGNAMPLDNEEADQVQDILQHVKNKNAALVKAVGMLEDALLVKPLQQAVDYNHKAAEFYQRCMQFTGPIMAKGGEDTAMYTSNSFIGHNDVGDTPESAHQEIKDFHNKMKDRLSNWPRTMNTTATHDTKRGEDARARLNTLTDITPAWLEVVQQWHKINKPLKQNKAPDNNDEYFIYQSLIGAYPMPGTDNEDFKERFSAYIQKALREAKTHTEWAAPNEQYESAVQHFIDTLLDENSDFIKSFKDFYSFIADAGIVNSLAQLVLKYTCPGIPDLYQGCELWDLSMVDPDNRRLVDYTKREEWLNELSASEQPDLTALWNSHYDGKIKLWLTYKLLDERSANHVLFRKGSYKPLKITGKYKNHLIAYIRELHHVSYIVIAPINVAVLAKKQAVALTNINWQDTVVHFPDDLPKKWTNLLTDESGKKNELEIKDLFKELPIAIIRSEKVYGKRSAGILLPVFSLPSPFGIGDLGPQLRTFADFLHRSGQKYWQILPLNPTGADDAHSPYNSISSMGGNPLMISPELLADEGLLDRDTFKQFHLPEHHEIDYAAVERIKNELLDTAYRNFKEGSFKKLKHTFEDYCRTEASWLDDLSLFVILKRHFKELPWNKWPDEYRKREATTLQAFATDHEEELNEVKWQQFIVAQQWKKARKYCNHRNIKIIGDVPFYVSYDSADVWAHPELFCLDAAGTMTGIAGVPPDYFSKTGQLWMMPTYNWEVIKESGYQWWIDRLKNNLQLFDLVRLDHFRAFEAYWQVPAGEDTAVNGEWLKGPGTEFFDIMKKEWGGLPFIAEDLGDHMDDVYALREKVGLPGMKVLEFAWGENMPVSVDAPHNYPVNCIVYTGTHDNNTVRGWFKEESSKADRKRLEQYTGRKVNENNINEALQGVAYASVAETAILPMQDILGLDADSRINTPGTANGNWRWRMPADATSAKAERKLLKLVQLYNRL